MPPGKRLKWGLPPPPAPHLFLRPFFLVLSGSRPPRRQYGHFFRESLATPLPSPYLLPPPPPPLPPDTHHPPILSIYTVLTDLQTKCPSWRISLSTALRVLPLLPGPGNVSGQESHQNDWVTQKGKTATVYIGYPSAKMRFRDRSNRNSM
jgi:hypothetical protein